MQSVVLPSRCIIEQALERTRHEGSSCLRHELRFGTPRLLLLLLCCCKLLHTKTTSGHAWILRSTSAAELFHMYRSSEQVHGYPKWKPRSIKKSGWETRGTRDPPSPPSVVVVVFLLVLLGFAFFPPPASRSSKAFGTTTILRPRLGPRLRLLLSSFTIQLVKRFRDLYFETSIRSSAPPSSLLLHHPACQEISGPQFWDLSDSASPFSLLLHHPDPQKLLGRPHFQHLYFETSVRSSALPSSAFTIEVLKSLWDVLNSGTSFLRPQWGPRFQLLPSSFTIQILKRFRDIDFETSIMSSASTSSSCFTNQILKSFGDILAFGTSILRPELGTRLLLLPSSLTIQILKKLRDLTIGISVRSRDLATDK